MVMTCGTGKAADLWFTTINVILKTTRAEVIYVDVEAELTQCFHPGDNSKVPCHMNYFEVRIRYGKDGFIVDNQSNETLKNQLYNAFSPLYNITNTSPHVIPTRNIQTFSFPQNNSPGVTFAVRSRGACGKIFRMKMYYYYCKETYVNGVKFGRTASPAKGFKNVTGNCSEYAISLNGTAGFNRYCYENGRWSNAKDNWKCFCVEGYTLNNGSCSSKLHDLY